MLRVCVIGMGPIGNTHSWAYSDCPDAKLVGVCDIREDRAKAGGAKFNVPYYLDAEEMLKELKPDLCSVATGGVEYSSDHYKPTMQALRAGCHVIGEKPISNDLELATEMVETAEKLNLCYGIDLNHRFTPAARQAKQWQNDGRIGDLLFCNMALWIGKTMPLDSIYYHLKALNPHSVDIIRHFMGDVDEVQCYAMTSPDRTEEGTKIYSTASINMKFKNGAVGHLTSSYDIVRGHPMERCEVAGLKGRLVFEDMWRQATLYPAETFLKEQYTNPVFGGFRDFDDTFRDRIHSFAREVSAGVKPENIDGKARDGLEASRVIHAAIESLKNGNKPVKVQSVTK
ncbi:MAG: Gfo/Idh/MocA family oxidoreductase [Oscillospiraceae bacterium]|nr:Gfo/Idh/MocA family oxidoreductase [Oscillospiraceae bacterium]